MTLLKALQQDKNWTTKFTLKNAQMTFLGFQKAVNPREWGAKTAIHPPKKSAFFSFLFFVLRFLHDQGWKRGTIEVFEIATLVALR